MKNIIIKSCYGDEVPRAIKESLTKRIEEDMKKDEEDVLTCSIGYEDYVTSLAILYHKSDLDLVDMLKSLPKDKTSTKQKKKRNKNKKTFGKNK